MTFAFKRLVTSHYRAYHQVSTSGNWKTNSGRATIEDVELTATDKGWADECCKIFGGLDTCTVGVMHDAGAGKEKILVEVNGTSSGLLPDHADQDDGHIRDLILEKMNQMVIDARQKPYLIDCALRFCVTLQMDQLLPLTVCCILRRNIHNFIAIPYDSQSRASFGPQASSSNNVCALSLWSSTTCLLVMPHQAIVLADNNHLGERSI